MKKEHYIIRGSFIAFIILLFILSLVFGCSPKAYTAADGCKYNKGEAISGNNKFQYFHSPKCENFSHPQPKLINKN